MTTNILEALIQLFALLQQDMTKRVWSWGACGALHACPAAKSRAEESLMRFDELVDQFQRIAGVVMSLRQTVGETQVKLLRTCTQINKGLEWHENMWWSSA